MRWKIVRESKTRNWKLRDGEVIDILLKNRGIETKKQREAFLHPSLGVLTPEALGIDLVQLKKAHKRIQTAIEKQETIVIYGDYDVDGVTGTAILWELLHDHKAQVHPYIPNRVEEGYGLSIKGIDNLLKEEKLSQTKLIITVDNGIVANEAVDHANQRDIDVIITDHHELPDKLPKAYAIIHTNDICGAGVGWILAREVILEQSDRIHIKKKVSSPSHEEILSRSLPLQDDTYKYLDLLTLSTVADLMPLTGPNRAIVAHGLNDLRMTKRIGLQELYKEAGIEDPSTIDVYEIGHIIAPRLNAMGRLESAMDSLRLLCTKSPQRAKDLAHLLGETNRGRQLLMQAAAMTALEEVKRVGGKTKIIIHVGDYEEGIIGLVAGRLVEAMYRPAIVISRKEGVSKASARSVSGFDIISFIRKHQGLLLNAGGHTMAAGFSLATENIEQLQKQMEELAESEVLDSLLERELRVDMELPLSLIDAKLYSELQTLSPFGLGNPEPTFVSTAEVVDVKCIGKDRSHVKMLVEAEGLQSPLESIGFGMYAQCEKLKPGQHIEMVYTVDENHWNNRVSLQLKLKDVKSDVGEEE